MIYLSAPYWSPSPIVRFQRVAAVTRCVVHFHQKGAPLIECVTGRFTASVVSGFGAKPRPSTAIDWIERAERIIAESADRVFVLELDGFQQSVRVARELNIAIQHNKPIARLFLAADSYISRRLVDPVAYLDDFDVALAFKSMSAWKQSTTIDENGNSHTEQVCSECGRSYPWHLKHCSYFTTEPVKTNE